METWRCTELTQHSWFISNKYQLLLQDFLGIFSGAGYNKKLWSAERLRSIRGKNNLALWLFIFGWKRNLSQGGGNCDQFCSITHFWHQTFGLGKPSRKNNFAFQPYKDSTHLSISAKRRLHNKKIKVPEWPGQIPVVNPAKRLRGELKRASQERPSQSNRFEVFLQRGVGKFTMCGVNGVL